MVYFKYIIVNSCIKVIKMMTTMMMVMNIIIIIVTITDDVKIYSSTDQQLKQSLKLAEMFSKDISMKLGLEKYKIQSILGGEREIADYRMENGEITGGLQKEDTYKYLGIKQA
jgi:Reverse transcriptase (RNA-dependent DNA polymerase).